MPDKERDIFRHHADERQHVGQIVLMRSGFNRNHQTEWQVMAGELGPQRAGIFAGARTDVPPDAARAGPAGMASPRVSATNQ